MADVRTVLRGHIVDMIDAEGSLSGFARKVGATPQNVRNWVAGDSSPSLDKVAEIAAAYGLTAGALLETPGDRRLTELLPVEADVVAVMRSMSEDGRRMVLQLAQALDASGAYRGR